MAVVLVTVLLIMLSLSDVDIPRLVKKIVKQGRKQEGDYPGLEKELHCKVQKWILSSIKLFLCGLEVRHLFCFQEQQPWWVILRSSQGLAVYLLITVQISRHNWPSFGCYSLQFAIFLYDSCHFLSQESSFLNLISQNVFLYRNWI